MLRGHLGLLGSASLVLSLAALLAQTSAQSATTAANVVVEVPFTAARPHPQPFATVQLDVVVTDPTGASRTVPAFWAGGERWALRYASSVLGTHRWRSQCSDAADSGLHGVAGSIEVVPYAGANALLQHGPVGVAADRRHFAHVDGTPFFWLGDTWWKCLCKRMTWDGFQELTADRQAKGFTVVQIVCGVYPDEGPFEARWENEGGKPYHDRAFTEVNPDYFAQADRRLQHLVAAGIVPAIVGGWGRGDCDGMALAGVAGMKRHWRHLIARYGAYPTIWIIGGESGGPEWTEVARYVQSIDPYRRPITMHPFDSARARVTDESVLDFDMLQTGHGGGAATIGAIPKLAAARARTPAMPALIGEYCYEGHMQTAFADEQRYVFWGSLLSGAAGLTYGAAGVWHASVDGDPGIANVYDRTTWREGMALAGSTQLGLGKALLAAYPWSRLEPHPEWVPAGMFAAGTGHGTDDVRFVYVPKRGVYDWSGIAVQGLAPGAPYAAFFFDPVRGTRFDLGIVTTNGTWDTPPVPSPQDWVLVLQALELDAPVAVPAVAAHESCAGRLSPEGAAFVRVDGPAWLRIAADGSFTGTPDEFDAGHNTWIVAVTKGGAAPTCLKLDCEVRRAPGVCFAESFRRYRGTQNGVQFESGRPLAYLGAIPAWQGEGEGALHAVDCGGTAAGAEPDWTVMLWQDNVLTSSVIGANRKGAAYRVEFELSAAVYAQAQQATQVGDALRVEVLRGDGSVLAQRSCAPGAWTGAMQFGAVAFAYEGDGSGDVRLRIGPAGAKDRGRFQGAVRRIVVRELARGSR